MWLQLVTATALILWLSTNKRYRRIYIACKTLKRDIKITVVYFKIFNFGRIVSRDGLSLNKAFNIIARKDPNKIALYFEDEKWTYLQVEEFSYKITKYFINEGYVKGDTIALVMENCPEYPCVYLGLSRIGVITALINTNLVKKPLLHSITIVNPKGIIVGSSCKKSIEEISSQLLDVKLYQLNKPKDDTERLPHSVNLNKEISNINGTPLEKGHYEPAPTDAMLYIYTSGTTGLPKASVLTHLRYLLGAKAMAIVGSVTEDDVLYTSLPLYHTAGGMLGLGQALVTGVPVVIRRKFSASNYFADCIKYNVTVAQYIGEMCRYLLASSSQEMKQKHKIRLMIGNGLKPQIWENVVAKFNIKNIVEIYGSTEGVSNLVNIDNKVGAVGYIPWFLRRWFTITMLRCDKNGELIKDAKGNYIECKTNEIGVAVGKIDQNKAVLRFEGYTDKEATHDKIIRNVYCNGDMYYNSGDILKCDELGYIYFVDRTGDTFRWKGENVSTSEVEAIISNFVQLADVAVYGVEIPNIEGKAGMAAIMDPNASVDVEALGIALKSNIASYAIPIFLRMLDSLPSTGTFKLKKVELRNEGYDLDKVSGRMYFFDSKFGNYVKFNRSLYENIQNGSVRL